MYIEKCSCILWCSAFMIVCTVIIIIKIHSANSTSSAHYYLHSLVALSYQLFLTNVAAELFPTMHCPYSILNSILSWGTGPLTTVVALRIREGREDLSSSWSHTGAWAGLRSPRCCGRERWARLWAVCGTVGCSEQQVREASRCWPERDWGRCGPSECDARASCRRSIATRFPSCELSGPDLEKSRSHSESLQNRSKCRHEHNVVRTKNLIVLHNQLTKREVGRFEVDEFDAVNNVSVALAGARSQQTGSRQFVRPLTVQVHFWNAKQQLNSVHTQEIYS